MSEHFRAFSFVDRILADESGKRISGRYHISPDLPSFPSALVTEAIGQLAAWSSIAATGFTVRPVAGIAGRAIFHEFVKPGDVLDLEATLVKADLEAVGYRGSARVGDRVVVELIDALGPMVPMEEFDDPTAVRERYDRILHGEADRFSFRDVPRVDVGELVETDTQEMTGVLHVPSEASFFDDHFPRNPVFPGTLLIDAKLRFAMTLAGRVAGGTEADSWRLAAVSDVKLRSFMPPGDVLEVNGKVEFRDESGLRVIVTTRKGRRLNSSARFELVREF